MKITAAVMALGLVAVPTGSVALSGHHSGGHHGGAYHGRHHRGHVYGFATSQCKSASCYRKHPNGKYVHPLTTRQHR